MYLQCVLPLPIDITEAISTAWLLWIVPGATLEKASGPAWQQPGSVALALPECGPCSAWHQGFLGTGMLSTYVWGPPWLDSNVVVSRYPRDGLQEP